jgi:site-specific DNA recombinase
MTVRVLGAVRQSKTQRDKSISPEAQRKHIAEWAGANDGEVVKFTFDLSTSGSTSAFKRKGLGPWLTESDKVAAWDVFVATKLDRACRDVADYLRLRDWCDKHGKRLVIINLPQLNDSTPAGRAMGTITATFAQLEREMAKERNKERYDELIELGRWRGGRLPYGFRYDPTITPIPGEDAQLVPDDGGTADVLRTMADMAIAGKSQGQIANWLNDNNHLSRNGRRWRTDTVRYVLRAHSTTKLLGETKAAQLRAALRAREQTRGERTNGHMLLRVAFCDQCGSPLYCQLKRDRPSGGYYHCIACTPAIYPARDKLEESAETLLLHLIGNQDHMKMELVPGDDHQAEIHKIEREIDALQRITGTETVITAKLTEIKHLESLPYAPDHYVPRPQGIKISAHWVTLDDQGKGAYMRSMGFKIKADQNGITAYQLKYGTQIYDLESGQIEPAWMPILSA